MLTVHTRFFVATILLSLALFSTVGHSQETVFEFDIKRQDLATALLDFSYQSNVQVLIPGVLVEGLLAPTIKGRYRPEQALALLLQRSGLEFSFTNERTVTIRLAQPKPNIRKRYRRGLERVTHEQMLVIAEAQREMMRDVTISMSSINGEDLESRGVTKADELQQFVPGLTVESPQSSDTQLSIRAVGIGSDDVSTRSGVAVFVDDVYIARQSAANMALYELDRVEVLRGPQSTLYAHNATGGALIYRSRKPSPDFEVRYATDVGNHGLFNNLFTINGEVQEKLSARLAFASLMRDPIMSNAQPGEPDGNNIDSQAGRMMLQYEPDANSRWLLSLDGEETTQDAVLFSIGPKSSYRFAPGLPLVPASQPERTADVDSADQELLQARGFMVRGEVSSERHQAIYILGRRSHDLSGKYDLDQTALQLVSEIFDETSEFNSLEARWMSPDAELSSQATRSISWMAGMHLSQEQTQVSKRFDAPGLAAGTNVWQQQLEDLSYAFYGQLEYQLSADLQLISGLRYVVDDRDFALRAETTAAGVANPYIQENFTFQRRRDWRRITPRLALHYQYSKETAFYTSISQAYKPGGFSDMASRRDLAAHEFNHERVTSVEAGLRSNVFANRMKFNLALFSSEFRDMQIVDYDNVGKTLVHNAEVVDVNGFELEVQARPLVALKISMGLSFVDSEFKQFQFRPPGLLIDKAGDSLPRIPDTNFTFSAAYLFSDLKHGAWSLRADASYRDDAVDINNDIALSDYRSYNLWLDYLPHHGKWQLAAWIRNLRDKTNFQATAAGGISASNEALARKLEPPRMYGMSLRYYW